MTIRVQSPKSKRTTTSDASIRPTFPLRTMARKRRNARTKSAKAVTSRLQKAARTTWRMKSREAFVKSTDSWAKLLRHRTLPSQQRPTLFTAHCWASSTRTWIRRMKWKRSLAPGWFWQSSSIDRNAPVAPGAGLTRGRRIGSLFRNRAGLIPEKPASAWSSSNRTAKATKCSPSSTIRHTRLFRSVSSMPSTPWTRSSSL